MPPNEWEQWSIFIRKELERLGDCYEDLRDELSLVRQDIILLKAKAGLWGAIGASIPIILLVVIQLLSKVLAP